MEKVQIEYTVNTPPNVIYKMINTPSGLAEWFADEVSIDNNIFTFKWDASEQKAVRLDFKKDEFVRFRWLEENEGAYFEFVIRRDELTRDVALIVTFFVDEDDIEEEKEIWDQQIYTLKHKLGLA